ncbi:hypothetical protein OKW96_17645 [Sphingobacterium sp. KU25419]|nr:hypothetical protein OKW96_17645 [Sphingobacterium sp. KU25419]
MHQKIETPGNTDYTEGVILLHEIFNGTNINENFVVGKLMAKRGSIYSGNRLNIVDINSKSAYMDTYAALTTVNFSGNVGIGTMEPQEKLVVKGKILAEEIKVQAINWPDYVFKPEYQLPSLAETEQYILNNGHLPEVPKATEVEANGVSLGEMNKILLKKVEELTLHLIDQQKQIKELQSKEK